VRGLFASHALLYSALEMLRAPSDLNTGWYSGSDDSRNDMPGLVVMSGG
jgi:hypothetical protein